MTFRLNLHSLSPSPVLLVDNERAPDVLGWLCWIALRCAAVAEGARRATGARVPQQTPVRDGGGVKPTGG